MATSLLKTQFHNSVADSVYKDIVTRTSNYYYFLGKTLAWTDEYVPETPIDNIHYENLARRDMIFAKLIKPTDVSFIIPKYEWRSGEVFDQYDDQYDTKLKGINLINGGTGYTTTPTVYIGSQNSVDWITNTLFTKGQLVKAGSRYYAITGETAISETIPTHTAGTFDGFTYVSVTDGNGSGASAEAVVTTVVAENKVTQITLLNPGEGYTSPPSVLVIGTSGSGCEAAAVVTKGSRTGLQKIEDTMFYVMTNEFKVFKCLDNNNGAVSTSKPISVSPDAITYSDGYIWKFMYIVPAALRNKFMSNVHLPVTTALRSLYFSAGEINTVRVDSMGSGYSYANIQIQGNGYLEADPIYVTEFTVDNGGSGYTLGSELIIDPPFTGSSSWIAETALVAGGNVQYNERIYEVVISGITDTIPPSHLIGTTKNGTCSLKFIGSTVIGVPIIDTGVITDVVLSGQVKAVDVLNPGSGYQSVPSVEIISSYTNWAGSTPVNLQDILLHDNRVYVVVNDGTTSNTAPTHTTGVVQNGTCELAFLEYKRTPTGICQMQNGSVISIEVLNPGSGLIDPPSVVVGQEWTASTVLNETDQIFFENKLYTVSTGGTTSNTAPTHSVGTVQNGTCYLTYVGIPATAFTSLKYGAGYSVAPTVIVEDSTGTNAEISSTGVKSDARLYPILNNGQLINCNIVDPGVGYTYANLTVTGDGTGALVSTDLTYGDINSLQSNVELLTIPGQINCIPVISGGYDYTVDDVTISIIGNGSGASAEAILNEASQIEKVRIISGGRDYTWARVVINSIAGRGASCRCIISPLGGHGKNALNELYAKRLMFYSNISQDQNQGFTVNNDYRQIGIIKGPIAFDSDLLLSTDKISACWAVSTVQDVSNIELDTMLYDIDDNRYQVIAVQPQALLVQSLDDASPVSNTDLHNDDYTLTISMATSPKINKYSGDMLFVDNKTAFTPTSEQVVTLRTTIQF